MQIKYARTHCRTNFRRLHKLATLCTLLKHPFRISFVYNGICLVEIMVSVLLKQTPTLTNMNVSPTCSLLGTGIERLYKIWNAGR